MNFKRRFAHNQTGAVSMMSTTSVTPANGGDPHCGKTGSEIENMNASRGPIPSTQTLNPKAGKLAFLQSEVMRTNVVFCHAARCQ